MDAYATTTELNTWTGITVADGSRLLDRASELVDSVVRTPFAVDTDGIPTNTDVAAAMRDATCAQVEQWIEVDEANDIDGLAASSISVAGYSGDRAPSLAPRAARILATAGLTVVHSITSLGR